MTRKFIGIFRSPGAPITDQLCRSELRQVGFSCDFCYPLIRTVLNAAQIANEFVAQFKTEFFNTICAEAAVHISVSANRDLTSASYPIAAVRVIAC